MQSTTTEKNQQPQRGESESSPDEENPSRFMTSIYSQNPYDSEAEDGNCWVADIGPMTRKEAKQEAARLAISGFWTTVIDLESENVIMSLAPGGESN